MAYENVTIVFSVTRISGYYGDGTQADNYALLPESKTTIETQTVKWGEEVYNLLSQIEEDAADYGDGVSKAELIAIYDADTKETLPYRNSKDWERQIEREDMSLEAAYTQHER